MSSSDIISIIANIAVILGIPVAIWTLKADHERRKKQSTIEFYQQIASITMDLRDRIREVFGEDTINPTDGRYISNVELQKIIKKYLTLIQRFSIGINIGVYDIDAFMRLSGRPTIKWFERLKPIIEKERESMHRDYAYVEFEAMVKKMEQKYKGKENKKGNIKLS